MAQLSCPAQPSSALLALGAQDPRSPHTSALHITALLQHCWALMSSLC